MLQAVYALLTLLLWAAWRRLPVSHSVTNTTDVAASMVVVVRNEAENLPALFNSLARQTHRNFEVFIVDDHSTDGTTDLVRQYSTQATYPIRLLELRRHPDGPPADGAFKKQGIAWAVGQATGELIVTTDGDCTVPPGWLAALAGCYRTENAVMVCGAVTFAPLRETVFSRLQDVEFASLIASGAATLQLGVPTMCNAANLAFTREAFLAVGGYRDTASAATGDDLFLMHKLHQVYGNRVRFLKNPAAVVRTLPQPNVAGFYHQRKRWASKWHLYRDWRVTALAVFVFLCNVSVVAALPLAAAGRLPWATLGTGLALRWAAEWLFVGAALRFLGQAALLPWMLLVQVVYPFYIVFFGLAAQWKGYWWKGRNLS